MSSLWLEHQVGIVFFLLALVAVALMNFRALRRLGEHPPPSRWPRVSILLPARHEEENIIPCVRSLLAQDYPDFEVLALYDDDPADGTAALLRSLAKAEPRLRVLEGEPLPPDWLGKHWACQQLAEAAAGELLLFTDADTRHHPRALREAVGALEATKADLLSALPKEELGSWAERLIVPLIPWSILSFLPLSLAHHSRSPALSAVSGPFMLFRRGAYRAIGGHAAVRGDVVDDLALGRRLKAQGLRLRLVDGQERISRRMYHTWRGVFEGFSKNLLAALGYRLIPFVLAWLWLGVVFLQPVIMLARGLAGGPTPPLSWGLAGGAVGLSILLWGLISWRLGLPRYLPLLYPLSILLSVILAFRSLALTLAGRTTWKGRRLIWHNLRWW
ncbi:MAG: glycosyltransferase [Candidatus Acetothermia bacterium]|nr:glycosyltransferase [Candidatus Acetothermia bacterium]MDH7506038.1 glycosyltransferase [Candidatus Acetothermia bacterium]